MTDKNHDGQFSLDEFENVKVEASVCGPQLQMPEGLTMPVLAPPPVAQWKPPEWAMPAPNSARGLNPFVDGVRAVNFDGQPKPIANGVNSLPIACNECVVPINTTQIVSPVTFSPFHTDVTVLPSSVASVNLISAPNHSFLGPADCTTSGEGLGNVGQPNLLQGTVPPWGFYPSMHSAPLVQESLRPTSIVTPQQSWGSGSPPASLSWIDDQAQLISGTRGEWSQPQKWRMTPKRQRGAEENRGKKSRQVHPTLSETEALLRKCKSRTVRRHTRSHHPGNSSTKSTARARSMQDPCREQLAQTLLEAEDELGRMVVDWKALQKELEIARDTLVEQGNECKLTPRLQPEPIPSAETQRNGCNRSIGECRGRWTPDVSCAVVHPLLQGGIVSGTSLHRC